MSAASEHESRAWSTIFEMSTSGARLAARGAEARGGREVDCVDDYQRATPVWSL